MHLKPRHIPAYLAALVALPLIEIPSPYATTLPEADFTYGHAGTIVWEHHKTNPIPQSCGGDLEPSSLVLFHPTLPCGTQVWLVNPASGASTLAVVSGNNTLFKDKNRLADLSPATAEALELDVTSEKTAVIAMHAIPEGADPLAIMSTELSTHLPKLPARQPGANDLKAAIKNGWAEANMEGTEGMAAVLFVTKNRAEIDDFRQPTIAAVVHAPYQFSWTHLPNPASRFPQANQYGYDRYRQWQTTAKDILTDRHSGNLLGLQYALGGSASHFYAPKLMKRAPKWTRSEKMTYISLPKGLEDSLGHKFYAFTRVLEAERARHTPPLPEKDQLATAE